MILKDKGDLLEIKMINGELCNFSNNEINIYQNIACIGEEIIQFKTAELLEENLYLLKDVAREMYGSIKNTSNKFILLDRNLQKFSIPKQMHNTKLKFRTISTGHDLDNYVESIFIFNQ